MMIFIIPSPEGEESTRSARETLHFAQGDIIQDFLVNQ